MSRFIITAKNQNCDYLYDVISSFKSCNNFLPFGDIAKMVHLEMKLFLSKVKYYLLVPHNKITRLNRLLSSSHSISGNRKLQPQWNYMKVLEMFV